MRPCQAPAGLKRLQYKARRVTGPNAAPMPRVNTTRERTQTPIEGSKIKRGQRANRDQQQPPPSPRVSRFASARSSALATAGRSKRGQKPAATSVHVGGYS